MNILSNIFLVSRFAFKNRIIFFFFAPVSVCARHCCTCISQIHKANDCACVRECVRVCVFASSEEGTGSKNNMYKNYNLIFNFQIKFSFGRVLGRGGGVKGNTELN